MPAVETNYLSRSKYKYFFKETKIGMQKYFLKKQK
jgi:hypothetical protein